MLGARVDTFDITVKDINWSIREDDEDPRAGIIFKLRKWIIWYASYR